MGGLFYAGVSKEQAQKVAVTVQLVGEKQGSAGLPAGGLVLHTHHVQRGQGEHVHYLQPPPEGQQLLHPRPALHHLAGAGPLDGLPLPDGTLPLGGGEAVLVNKLGELQIQEQLI